MNILITGCNGFVGQHLSNIASERGHTIFGIGRDGNSESTHIDNYINADLSREFPSSVGDVDVILHLAGLAAVGPSFDNPQQYININSSMITNMCEHYLHKDTRPRIIIVSSGAVYDNEQPMPITESSKFGFSSPYAVSKILTEHQAAYYRKRGLDCIVVRPFNHIGPGQGKGFIVPDLYEKILSAPKNGVINVGNIDTRRDYTDVRDIADAYIALAEVAHLNSTTYNACSGTSRSGREIFELLKATLGRDDVNASIDPELTRPNEVMEIIGDNSTLQSEIDWSPSYSLEQTLEDFVKSAKL